MSTELLVPSTVPLSLCLPASPVALSSNRPTCMCSTLLLSLSLCVCLCLPACFTLSLNIWSGRRWANYFNSQYHYYSLAVVAPIFDRTDKTKLLGVIIADKSSAELGDVLSSIQKDAGGGVVYITEAATQNGSRVDILQAATSGNISESVNGQDRLLFPSESSNSMIRKSFRYLTTHYTDGQSLETLESGGLWEGHTLMSGDPYMDQPVIGTVNCEDPNVQGINWRIVVALPWYLHTIPQCYSHNFSTRRALSRCALSHRALSRCALSRYSVAYGQ